MLGLRLMQRQWEWGIYGKHPSFGDYISHNLGVSLFDALSNWIDIGTHLVCHEPGSYSHYGYRFWIRGVNRGTLVCGILKSSSDSSGRSYPLTIMGTGAVKGWEKNWDLVFRKLDPVLRGMEELSSQRFTTIREMEEKLEYLRCTQSLWDDGPSVPDGAARTQTEDIFSRLSGLLKAHAGDLTEQDHVAVSVDDQSGTLPGTLKYRRGTSFFKRSSPMPLSVFWGGSTDKTVIRMFRKPLGAADFKRMFT